MASRRPAALPPPPPPPLCEGWIEKFALCRGMFASKGWHRRYAFLTNEGLGLCHTNPRDKGGCLAGHPLKPSQAKSFIPFEKKRHGETELAPVYVVDDVSAARHPEVPQRSHNGICSESMSSADGASLGASTKDVTRTGSGLHSSGNGCTFYYFGLTFEEHRKRYLLLLRTSSPQEYIKWTTYLPLYVHEGSASRIVPMGHPLEAGRQQPVDLNHRRLTEKRESVLPCAVTFYLDPDPCTPEEYAKLRRTCLGWNEGERERLFSSAMARVRALCGASESTASDSIASVQDQSEKDYREYVFSQFEELAPVMADYESRSLPHTVNNGNSCSAGSPGAAYARSSHNDAAEGAATDPSVAASNKVPISSRLLPSFFGNGGAAEKDAYKHPRYENGEVAAYSDPSMNGRG